MSASRPPPGLVERGSGPTLEALGSALRRIADTHPMDRWEFQTRRTFCFQGPATCVPTRTQKWDIHRHVELMSVSACASPGKDRRRSHEVTGLSRFRVPNRLPEGFGPV